MRIVKKLYKHPDGRAIFINGVDTGQPGFEMQSLIVEADLMAKGFKPVPENEIPPMFTPGIEPNHKYCIDKVQHEPGPVAYSICRTCGDIRRCPFN